MEHLQHFGLRQDPFSNEPDLRYFFESGSHRDAQCRVERGLRQHKGLTLLTGEGGMGKTLLARRVLEALEEEVFEATLLVMLPGAADATSILQRFARQIGADDPATDRATLLGQIYEQLAIVREDGRHAVLIIDDAQIMTAEDLSELGGLLSLEYEDRRLLSMLLVGSSELDRLVENDPSMMPRVDVRVRIQPLDLANARAYLAHRLTSIGGEPSLVPESAVDALHKFGRGRPRLLNTLADNALFEAYLVGRSAIEASDVERAAHDLGIGPDPGTTYSGKALSQPPQPSPPPPPIESSAAPVAGGHAAGATSVAERTAPLVLAEDLSEDAQGDTPGDALSELAAVSYDDELELVSEVPNLDPASAGHATLDLDVGLEAALADFDEPVQAAAPAPSQTPALDALDFDVEPVATPRDRAVPPFELAEVELAEAVPGEPEELEGLFVELLDE